MADSYIFELTDEEQAAVDERNRRIEEMYPDLPHYSDPLPTPAIGIKVHYDQSGSIIRIETPEDAEP